jgi:ssDNA-binding Zn-finger/Zn-ribbon topoisomerase 1
MTHNEDKTIFHVDAKHKREELPEYDQLAPCPKCGGETETSYGLAGGGFGIYAYCPKCEVITSKSETD